MERRLAERLLGKKIPLHQKLRAQAMRFMRQGNVANAEKIFRGAIQAHKPDDTFFKWQVYNDMGCMFSRQNDFKKAVDSLEAAVAEGVRVAGTRDDAKVSVAEKNLAFALKSNEKTKKRAISLYETLFDRYTSILNDKVNAAEVAYELANLLNDVKEFKKAAPYARRCLAIRQESKRVSDIQIAPVLCLLAAIISAPDIAQFDEAERLAYTALDISKKIPQSWSGLAKTAEVKHVQTLIMSIRRGRQAAKRAAKKAKKKKRGTKNEREIKDTSSGGNATTSKPKPTTVEPAKPASSPLDPAARATIAKWRAAKVAAWEAKDAKLRAKCPTRDDLEAWMTKQTQKSLARKAAASGSKGT